MGLTLKAKDGIYYSPFISPTIYKIWNNYLKKSINLII